MASADGLRRAVKGLSEAVFRERFGTEEACREALFAMRWREGPTCPACGHRGFCQLTTRQLFQVQRVQEAAAADRRHGVSGYQAAADRLVCRYLPSRPGQERDQRD